MLTVQEVAAIIHVHPNTIRNWMKIGRLKYFKEGHTVRIAKEEIENFINGG